MSIEAKQIKAQLLVGACVLANGVDAMSPGKLPIDQTITDAGLLGANIENAQLVKVYYNYLRQAFENTGTDKDSTANGWQDPAVQVATAQPVGTAPAPSTHAAAAIAGATAAQLLSALAPLVPTFDATAISALNSLVAKIPAPTPAPAPSPVPSTPAPIQSLPVS